MMFGRASQPEKQSLGDAFENNLMGRNSLGSSGSYDEYKAMANQVAGRMGEKATDIKTQAMDWFANFT